MAKVVTKTVTTKTKNKMKTRKKMLFMSCFFILAFTTTMIYLMFIGITLNDTLIEKFFNFCIWCVVGSGVCGVASKKREQNDVSEDFETQEVNEYDE